MRLSTNLWAYCVHKCPATHLGGPGYGCHDELHHQAGKEPGFITKNLSITGPGSNTLININMICSMLKDIEY